MGEKEGDCIPGKATRQKVERTAKEDAEFKIWWEKRGYPLVCRMALYPSAPLLRDLCEVAYWQGRIDENVKQGTQLNEQLTRLNAD